MADALAPVLQGKTDVVAEPSMPSLVIDVVTNPLAELGFDRRRKAGPFTLELNEDFLGFLGLQMATQHYQGKAVDVLPTVGVRHQQVESVVAELREDKVSSYIPPTVSGPLYMLVPGASGSDWHVDRVTVSRDVQPVLDAIRRFAVPAMRAISDLDALEQKIEEGWGFEHLLVYRLPIVRALNGNATGARRALAEALASLGGRTDAAAQALRAFEAPFDEWLRRRTMN